MKTSWKWEIYQKIISFPLNISFNTNDLEDSIQNEVPGIVFYLNNSLLVVVITFSQVPAPSGVL